MRGFGSTCEQSFSATVDLRGEGEKFTVMDADSAAVLDTGGAANLVRSNWLGNRDVISESSRVSRAETYPACA